MILGLGLDLVAVERIAGVYARQGERFLDRVYTAEERRYCLLARDPAERLAARWAAKEACMKALGTGWANGVGFTQIGVISDHTGPPRLELTAAAADRAAALGMRRLLLSLTHSDGMAAAVVIIES